MDQRSISLRANDTIYIEIQGYFALNKMDQRSTSLRANNTICTKNSGSFSIDVVESKRYVSCMTITLSITDEDIDKNDKGYQVST